jgi:plastocyanin
MKSKVNLKIKMENQTKNISWIIGGVIVAAVVVYLLASGNVSLISQPKVEGVKTDQGIVAAPGTSAVSDSGVVVNKDGNPVKQDVAPGSPEAPQQSNPVTKESLPASAVKLDMSSGSVSPASFTVKAGAPVTLSVTSKDETHVFLFDDASLSAVAIGVGPAETRAITFNAPTKKGEYPFHCDVPGHSSRGEVGKMIVE